MDTFKLACLGILTRNLEKKTTYKRSMEVVKNDHYMWVNWLFLAIFEVLAPGLPYK